MISILHFTKIEVEAMIREIIQSEVHGVQISKFDWKENGSLIVTAESIPEEDPKAIPKVFGQEVRPHRRRD